MGRSKRNEYSIDSVVVTAGQMNQIAPVLSDGRLSQGRHVYHKKYSGAKAMAVAISAAVKAMQWPAAFRRDATSKLDQHGMLDMEITYTPVNEPDQSVGTVQSVVFYITGHFTSLIEIGVRRMLGVLENNTPLTVK